jgi:hypothetical protein
MVAEGSRRPVDDLEVLAQARFPELSQAELKLLRAAPKGEVAWCGTGARATARSAPIFLRSPWRARGQ